MSLERFKSKLCSGHKDNAVQVPFDPGIRWSTPAQALRPGRRGFRVQASLNGIGFESAIVARSGKFWLLVPGEIFRDVVDVSLRTSQNPLAPTSYFLASPRRDQGPPPHRYVRATPAASKLVPVRV